MAKEKKQSGKCVICKKETDSNIMIESENKFICGNCAASIIANRDQLDNPKEEKKQTITEMRKDLSEFDKIMQRAVKSKK